MGEALGIVFNQGATVLLERLTATLVEKPSEAIRIRLAARQLHRLQDEVPTLRLENGACDGPTPLFMNISSGIAPMMAIHISMVRGGTRNSPPRLPSRFSSRFLFSSDMFFLIPAKPSMVAQTTQPNRIRAPISPFQSAVSVVSSMNPAHFPATGPFASKTNGVSITNHFVRVLVLP